MSGNHRETFSLGGLKLGCVAVGIAFCFSKLVRNECRTTPGISREEVRLSLHGATHPGWYTVGRDLCSTACGSGLVEVGSSSSPVIYMGRLLLQGEAGSVSGRWRLGFWAQLGVPLAWGLVFHNISVLLSRNISKPLFLLPGQRVSVGALGSLGVYKYFQKVV